MPIKREEGRDRMDVDRPARRYRNESDEDRGELKIRGQAAASKKGSRWENKDRRERRGSSEESTSNVELERRETELKERALRNKVIRTRKRSAS